MSCNNLGLWAYSDTSIDGLCFSSTTLTLSGDNLSKGESIFTGTSCTIGNEVSTGYFSNSVISFYYLGSIRYFKSCLCDNNYCVDGTSTYDDTYEIGGIFDNDLFYTGQNSTYVIYYSSGQTQWCLSSYLGGSCHIFGPTGSLSSCPDLDSSLFSDGVCPTTTTTTDPCSTFDFEAIFDCLISPTPTPTPAFSPTPTPTPTPSPSDPCGGFVADVGGLKKTPIPSSSPTPTPTLTPDVTRPCHFSGSVTFNAVNQIMTCANSKKFKDCFTGIEYYTTQNLYDESGNTLTQGMVYSTYINGIAICAIFEGLVENISGIDNLQIISTVSLFNDGGCVNCTPETPDPILECIVVNSECGTVNVNPGSFINGKLSYSWVFPILPQYSYEIYWDSINIRWICRETTSNQIGGYLYIDSELPVGSFLEWDHQNTIFSSTDCIEGGAVFFTTLLSTPCPTPSPTLTPTPTVTPCVQYSYPISNNSATVNITVYYSECDKIQKSFILVRGTSQYICSSIVPYSSSPQDFFVGLPTNPC
jgi:hypothetical protein